MSIKYVNKGVQGGISEAMKVYANKKLDFMDDLKLTIESINGEKIEVGASFTDKFNHHYRLSSIGDSYHEAIDLLKDKAKKSTKRYKEKVADKKHNKHVDVIQELELPEVVKSKVLITSVMNQEDAIKEMEELGHDWYVYRNNEDEICILYKRYDGHLGIMITK